MKIVILIYQIIQEKFAYGDFFMSVMIEYIFMFKMVKKMQNSGFEPSPLKVMQQDLGILYQKEDFLCLHIRGEFICSLFRYIIFEYAYSVNRT